MTPLKAELKRLRELRANLKSMPYKSFPISFFEYDEVGKQTKRAKTMNEYMQFGLVASHRWLSLIDAIEVACEALKYVGCDCDTDECTCEHYIALAEIEQLICGEKK